MVKDNSLLEKTLEYSFCQPHFLHQALTHSSAISADSPSNQRMEFLGDRVLGLVVARLLYDSFKNEEEGNLSRRHTALVRREALERVALRLGLGDYIDISRAEEQAGGRDNSNILADTCEAVIAALYFDGGIDAAEKFILTNWTSMMNEDSSPPKDAKTTLQEWAQSHNLALPSYQQTARHGADHAPVFFIEVAVDGFNGAKGSGPSKRAAEQKAAKAMLAIIEAA